MKLIIKVYNLYLLNKNPIKYWRKMGAKIGLECEISSKAHLGSEPYLIEIGNHVRINFGVHLITHDGGVWVLRSEHAGYGNKYKYADNFGEIKIGNNVHIGTNAIVMPGVIIGDNVIIACNAVVTHNVPSNTIVGGVPARMIESIEEYERKNKSNILMTKNLELDKKKELLLEIIKRGETLK